MARKMIAPVWTITPDPPATSAPLHVKMAGLLLLIAPCVCVRVGSAEFDAKLDPIVYQVHA
eukprot:m.38628 g.38628  ORF g.38628 m.38628 type:complete len:61 (+) comp32617_c1_seq2:600-782(+)